MEVNNPKIPTNFVAHSDVIRDLDQMVEQYVSMRKNPHAGGWNYFWTCYSEIIRLHKEGKIFIYDSDHDFGYLSTLFKNDGPEFAVIIHFGASKTDLYKIGVCVRGAPLLEKVTPVCEQTMKPQKRKLPAKTKDFSFWWKL